MTIAEHPYLDHWHSQRQHCTLSPFLPRATAYRRLQHVISIPSYQTLRFYHAHSASITSVSVSPCLPSTPQTRVEVPQQKAGDVSTTPSKRPAGAAPATASPRTPQSRPVPASRANSIFIATSSIDGHVCVSSLLDPKDVTLRNFSRPVQAVAVSPDYRSDRSYLSGGLAGSLILTIGGRPGSSAKANPDSPVAAAASGWLNSLGLAQGTGKDVILHSGEGPIGAIAWSLSGKFVVWTNEQGIKVMRSNLNMEGLDAESAWKRIAHISKPNRTVWNDMAGSWKARLRWIDDMCIEPDDAANSGEASADVGPKSALNGETNGSLNKQTPLKTGRPLAEKLLVGWGDTIWILKIAEGAGHSSRAAKTAAGAEILHM